MVDDGSDPPLATLGADVRVIRNEVSCGACAGRNSGIAAARGQIIGFLDDDAELSDAGTIARAIMLMESNPGCGAVAFRQIAPDGAPISEQPAYSETACLAAQFFSYGALVRASVLNQVGYFETSFRYYWEEIEMSIRILDAGWSIIYDPQFPVVHHQDIRGRDQRGIKRLILRNFVLTALMRYPAWCVPPAVMLALGRHLRRTAAQGSCDWLGAASVAAEIARRTPYALSRRKPVRFATLRAARRIKQAPPLLESGSGARTDALSPA